MLQLLKHVPLQDLTACMVEERQARQSRQDYTHVSLTACMVVERQARQFVQAIEEIEESSMDQYPCLWELKNRQHDAVLNGLPDMPRSPHELFEILKDTEASASTPFGRLPPGGQAEPQFLKVGLPFMEAFYQTSSCFGVHFWIFVTLFGVRRGFKMILSHRAPSSLNMSSYRTIWTHFRQTYFCLAKTYQIQDPGTKILVPRSWFLLIRANCW